MRKLLPVLGLFFVGNVAQAQFFNLYSENFDGTPPYAVTVSTIDNNTAVITPGVGWNDTAFLSVSAPNSMHAVRTQHKSKYLTTNSFSTAGMTHAILEFDQIAKVYLLQQCWMEYSIDGGATWSFFPQNNSVYLGSSSYNSNGYYFNEASYPDANSSVFWDFGNDVTPTSSWWAHETFDLTSFLIDVTGTGYTNCMIRWNLKDANAVISTTHDGWFVDNIKITGATCELIPPAISWNFATASHPEGARYQTSQTIRLEASDASGIDTVLLYYSLNGAPDTAVVMTASVPGGCATTSNFAHTISGLAVGDTVAWRVEVEDCACPNVTIYPNQAAPSPTISFWLNQPPPIKCGNTTVNSFPYVVDVLPWEEGFENPNWWVPGTGTGDNGTGNSYRGSWPMNNPPGGQNWEVSPNPSSPGYAWSIRNGPTFTPSTGPTGDHSPSGSGNYVYTEASQNYPTLPSETTPMNTPCIKVPAVGKYVMEFSYHLFGIDFDNNPSGTGPGLLRVDIDTGHNAAAWSTHHAFIVGQQQSSPNDAWRTEVVDLTPFSGQTIRFKFLGVRRHGGPRQDIAVDNIKVIPASPSDIELLTYEEPKNGYCSYSSSEDIIIRLRSRGHLDVDTVPLAFSVSLNGGPAVIHRDTILDTLALGEVITYTYNPKGDLSVPGQYKIFAWAELSGDVQFDNDTIGPLTIDHIAPISSYPSVLDFEEPGTVYGDGTINSPGVIGSSDWIVQPPASSSALAWTIGRDVTKDFNTGPRRDFSEFGHYLYADSRATGTNVTLLSMTRCYNFTGLTSPTMSFWHHMFGSNIDIMILQVQLDGQLTWSNVAGSLINGQQQSSELDAWKWKKIDLSAYAGQMVRLRLLARSTGAGSQHDMAIDNLMVWDEAGQSDVGVAYTTAPGPNVDLNVPSSKTTTVVIQNYGGTSVSNVPLNVRVTDACDPSQTNTVTHTVPGPIAAGARATVTLPTPPVFYLGAMFIEAWTSLASDANRFNDTAITMRSSGSSLVPIPYDDLFDSCDYDTKGWFSQGGISAWEFGTPQKGGSWNNAYSGNNAWNLSRRFGYQDNNEILRVPPLIGFDTIMGAQLRFRHRYNFGADDGGRVEFFTGGVWNQFGFMSTQVGSDWYDANNIDGLGGSEGWTGSNTNWKYSIFPIFVWNNNSNPLRLRFLMGASTTTSGGSGWSIDNFSVFVPPQNSASVQSIDTREYLVIPGEEARLYARIENTGERPLDSCFVRYRVNSNPWTNWETFNPSSRLNKFASQEHDFDSLWHNAGPGIYKITVETSIPNDRVDGRPIDDTMSVFITVLDEFTPSTDSINYCTDFEDPNSVPWLPLHSFNKAGDQEWEFGTPTNWTPTSGTHAWEIKLDTTYTSVTESSLHTPFFIMDTNMTYKMSFNHKMLSEQFHDGGSVMFSFDGGINWYTLGAMYPNNKWYNTEFITSMDIYLPGWSGDFDWTHSEMNFKPAVNGKVVFRFRFTSDYTQNYDGWMIDDFCLMTTTDEAQGPAIGLPENAELNPISNISLYPNPADHAATLEILAADRAHSEIQVTDLSGKLIYTTGETLVVGENHITFNTSDWSNGVYLVTVKVKDRLKSLKLIVNR